MKQMQFDPVTVSGISVLISVLALLFARYSWHQSNRPLISARVTTVASHNTVITLNIIIENTGNRPGRDILLIARRRAVLKALTAEAKKNGIPDEVSRCLLEN